MGNIFSDLISVTYEVIISHCAECSIRKAKYISELEDNLDALPIELQKLIEARNDVMRKVTIAEQQQLKRTDQLEGWLSRVQAVEAEASELLAVKSQEVEKLCLAGYCSKNCKSSYKFGKKVAKMLQLVAILKDEGYFEAVAEKVPEAAVDERPIEPTIVGLESTFDQVWRCFVEEESGIIGLYGMGGVGKTTLLTQINNKLHYTPNDFNVVIWVVVSKSLRLEEIQETIGKKIGLFEELWKIRTLEEKSLDIFRILSKKKFVLFLDDIWDRVDLTKVGVPIPDSINASKVVFTTRSLDVCGLMEAYKKFKIECLGEEEAWKLFQKKVGEDTLGCHPDILDLAKLVAKECGGLPLALITTSRAMCCKTTPEEWRDAIQVLRRSASEFSGMEDKVYSLLKYSYDSLSNDKIRSCLLYCSLFSEDFAIPKSYLIDLWLCEGFFDEYDEGAARDQVYSIIGVLVRACLLEEPKGGADCVKMHDVIRDMALWIACNIEKEKEYFLVRAGVAGAPSSEKWESLRRISLMSNHRIENLLDCPTCPHLLTLFLNDNSLKKIGSDLFQNMPSLKVLCLKDNPLTELPLSIQKLASLQFLDLSYTKIKELPIELKALINLKCLGLDYTYFLRTIPRGLIASFSKLNILRMATCSFHVPNEEIVEDSILFGGGEFLVEEMLHLKCLNKLTITLRSFHAFQRFVSSFKLRSCTEGLSLHCEDSKLLNVSCLVELKHLECLEIVNCKYLEELRIDHVTLEPHSFHRLTYVEIEVCPKLRDLTWIVFVKSLHYLRIVACDDIEEIVSVGKLGEVPETMGSLEPFANLRSLVLIELPNLKTICQKTLSFPLLRGIYVDKCPKLERLPLNSSSSNQRTIEIWGKEQFWEELQWEDEATKNYYLPGFKSR